MDVKAKFFLTYIFKVQEKLGLSQMHLFVCFYKWQESSVAPAGYGYPRTVKVIPTLGPPQ
jgi:hypothetical protein